MFMTRSSAIQIRLLGRMPLNRIYNWRLFVVASVFLASSLMCWSVVVEGPKLTLAIAIIPLVLPFMVAYAAMTESGIMDPAALFPAFFGMYNGIPLIGFLSDDVRNNLAYPVKFDPYVFFRAGLISALGAIFIAITWAVWKPLAHKRLPIRDVTGWFKTGIICYAIGILLYFLQYLQLGGYWAALAIERTRRFEVMAEKISLPYFAFVLVGLVMTTASGDQSRKRAAAILMTALWCVLVMVQGDRRLMLQTVLAVLSAATFLVAKSTRIRMKHLAIVLAAYTALAVAGQLRGQIPGLLSDSGSQHKVLDPSKDKPLLDSVTPGNAEFGGPFLSVLYNVEHVTDYWLGKSYIDTIPCILPRIIYHSKPPSPATELANEVHRGRIFGFAAAGWGYSPIAEAFLNFGILGVCVISSIWMGAFISLSRLRNYRWGLVIAAVLTPETINANRIDFRTVYLEAFSCTVVVIISALVAKSLYQVSSSRSRHRVAEARTLHQGFHQPNDLKCP